MSHSVVTSDTYDVKGSAIDEASVLVSMSGAASLLIKVFTCLVLLCLSSHQAHAYEWLVYYQNAINPINIPPAPSYVSACNQIASYVNANSATSYYKDFRVVSMWPTYTEDVYGCLLRGKHKNIRDQYTDSSYRLVRRGTPCTEGEYYEKTTGACISYADAKQRGSAHEPLSCNAPAKTAGNPINFAVGNKFQHESDYQFWGNNPFGFSRSYNSNDGLWRHSFSMHLRIADAQIVLVQADGRESFFKRQGDIVTPPATDLGMLERAESGWRYKTSTGEAYSFDGSGRLIQQSNGRGYSVGITYATDYNEATDSFGRKIKFIEDVEHQPLQAIINGLSINYSYNAVRRLIQVTQVKSSSQQKLRRYHYEDTRDPKLLTGITDEQGIRFATWAYDAQGRAMSSEHAGGTEKVLVSYNVDGSSTVTNELGKKATYRFQTIEGVKRITAIEGEPSPNCPSSNSSYAYNARGQVERKTDNKGNVTIYSYNERGQEISRTEAYGTPQARTITTAWHPSLALPLTVTEPGRVTRYQYDDQGRPLGQSVEPN